MLTFFLFLFTQSTAGEILKNERYEDHLLYAQMDKN